MTAQPSVFSWPTADLPLADTVTLCFPFDPVEASPEEILTVLPSLEQAMRAVDPTVRSATGEVVRNAVNRDFRGRTICVHPLALVLHVRLACEVLPQDRARRQSALVRGVIAAALNPERG